MPKFRQLVTASGRAPVQTMLRAASATAAWVPAYGSRLVYQGLPSVVRASPLLVPATRSNAASPPGPKTVLFCT